MSGPRALLLAVLSVLVTAFVIGWAVIARRRRKPGTPVWPDAYALFVGFITNFFDTLGIGSFATTTSMYKIKGAVRDELIPGTLNVGHTPPTFVQALIFIASVAVDMKTLALMIGSSVVGAWLGAGIVSGWPRRNVQIGMGWALLGAATLLAMRLLKLFPPGGDTIGLEGLSLAIGVAVNFVLGALMTMGIGLYAPCMILVSLLGMSPDTAFPIMMGSCAFLMPVGSLQFLRKDAYDLRAALGLTMGGLPAVALAVLIVWKLPLDWVRGLVIVVVVYTAIMMLRSAALERQAAAAGGTPAA